MSKDGLDYYPFTNPPRSNTERPFSVEEMSDGERASEFGLSGNPEYLTPALGLKMQLPREVLAQIPGITEEDLLSVLSESNSEQFEEECLVQFGLDDESLKEVPPSEAILRFYDVARLPIEHLGTYERDELREDIHIALSKLTRLLIEKENFVYQAFHAVRFEDQKGIHDIETLHETYRSIYKKFIQLSHDPDVSDEDEIVGENCACALNEFSEVVKGFLRIEPGVGVDEVQMSYATFPPDTNYLVSKYAENFLYHIGVSEDAHIDEDDFAPFEVAQGTAAVFSADKSRLYVVEDAGLSEEILRKSKEFLKEVRYEERGQYLARHTTVDVPDELYDVVNLTIDNGIALGSDEGFGAVTDEDVRDYISLLRSDARLVIQDEFGVELKDLRIREQLYFLGHLKDTTVEKSEALKDFTATYGVTGMRTFLSLERGAKDLGDKIVSFGQHQELAPKVFDYYCELLDIAEGAERLVEENTDCEGDLCVQYTDQVRENILNRAQKDLERAVDSNQVTDIERLLGTYVAEAKEHVALLQELGVRKTEVIATGLLDDEDKNQMRSLLEQNYNSTYASEEDTTFRETIKASLEKSFLNPATEFHLLRHKNNIISFNRFDNAVNQEGKSISYFGSFNADPTYSGVGGVMLEKTIKDQLEKCEVMCAHCDPTSDIAKKYIESGFVAKETETVAGKFSFEIWRTKDIVEHLKSKQMSIETLLAGDYQENNIEVREVKDDEAFEELDEGLGYLLTRYFKHDGKTYAVFEIPSPTLWNQFQV